MSLPSPSRGVRVAAMAGLVVLVFLVWRASTDRGASILRLSKYSGPLWRTPSTFDHTVVFESKWQQMELHTVSIENGKAISGWVWNNYHDQVNILAEFDGRFIVFRQTKYGLEGQSLAVVGGIIEDGESANEAAQRELMEELQLVAGEWVELGRYRTDVNRGMGWCHCYLARSCRRATAAELRKSDDLERQERVNLTLHQLEQRVLAGEFKEVKWSNTVALSILHLKMQSA